MSPEPPLVDQWRSLLSRYSRVSQELDRALSAEHGLTMSDYEVLDRLVTDSNCKSRVNDLLVDLHLTQSALSRAIARLEKSGLVGRDMCPTDRRGVFVTATDKGRELQKSAKDTQLAVLRKHLVPLDED